MLYVSDRRLKVLIVCSALAVVAVSAALIWSATRLGDTVWQWGLSVGVTALTALVLHVLFAGWPPAALPRPERGIAQIRDSQGRVVGSAFTAGRRLMVTCAHVVNRALERGDTAQRFPHRRSRIWVQFPILPGGGGGDRRTARVQEWGPARSGLAHRDVAVLRLSERLPRRIPRLRLGRSGYEGRATVVVTRGSADAPVPVEPAQVPVTIADQRLQAPAEAAVLHGSGGPILGEGDHRVVGLLRADGSGGSLDSGIMSGPGAGSEIVTPDEVRALLRRISRRRMLTAALATAGASVLVGTGALAVVRHRRPPLTGAGWTDLFADQAIRDRLADRGLPVGDVWDVSGMNLLRLSREQLATLDFVVSPNLAIAHRMRARCAGLRCSGRPWQICNDRMVVLARRDVVPGLGARGIMIRYSDAVLLDLDAYYRAYGSLTWSDVGLRELDDGPGSLVRIAYADPLETGGGEMFLAAMAQVATGEGASTAPVTVGPDGTGAGTYAGGPQPAAGADVTHLWSAGGPLAGQGTRNTRELLTNLVDRQDHLVYVHEHEAIAFLARSRENAVRYTILRTAPEANFDQYVMSGDSLGMGEVFSGDEELQRLMVDRLSVRAVNSSGLVDERLSGDPLAGAVWSEGPARQVAGLPADVTVAVPSIQGLLEHMCESVEAQSRCSLVMGR